MSYTVPTVIELIGIGSAPSSVSPNPPTIVSASQANGNVVIGATEATISGTYEPLKMNLYRNGTLIYGTYLSPTALENLLFDYAAVVGTVYAYTATTVDIHGNESSPSAPVSFSAFNPASFDPFNASRSISPAAYGPYPLLGSDLYLDPTSLDIVPGPNGDYMTVTGLACLAQDLRIRFLTEVGELPLQPTFGFARGGIIGAGQASPQATAAYLHTTLIDILNAEPRVLKVISVEISHLVSDAWTISYVIEAIGVEDPQQLNMVIPYSSGGSRSVPASAT